MAKMLIIRPQGLAEKEIAVCKAAGWGWEVLSPVKIVADETALQQLPQQAVEADVVFWVSPGAVKTAAPHFDFSDGSQIHATVSKASKTVLERYCPHPVAAPDCGKDSEAVWAMPLWKALPEKSRVLIVRGKGGRNFLTEKFMQKGLKVSFAEVYSREVNLLDFNSFDSDGIRAAYITSAGQAEALFAQVPPQFARFFKTLLYLTHHPRVAVALKAAGAQHIRTIEAFDGAIFKTV